MMKRMTYFSGHLTSLRQEITTLRNMNVRYSEKSEHTPIEQAALELRTNRLLQIKRELLGFLGHPGDSAVWWETSRVTGASR
jgi:hypothetical protein